MAKTYFFRDHPIIGLTVGTSSAQLMQVTFKNKQPVITAYGNAPFDLAAVKEGVIVDPANIAAAIASLLKSTIQGDVVSKRLAVSIPGHRTFSRVVTLPKMSDEQLHEAVLLETEQYTPAAIDDLYVDYSVINKTDTEFEVYTLAAPKEVIDPYLEVARLLDLEVVLIETRADSMRRLFAMTEYGSIPSVLLDFAQQKVDISIVDRNLITSGTVNLNENFGKQITEALNEHKIDRFFDSDEEIIPPKQSSPPDASANISAVNTVAKATVAPTTANKTPAQPNTAAASETPENQLQQFIKEIRRMVRYYEERYNSSRHIEQIVLVGDQLKIPSLAALMTDKLRLPVRSTNMWKLLAFDDDISSIPFSEGNMYLAVAGLCSVNPKEIFG